MKSKLKFKYRRPSRTAIGMSPSDLKTLLRVRGYKLTRDFYKENIAVKHGRLFRFRWWSEGGFVVDVSCPVQAFDRWANSSEQTMPFADLMNLGLCDRL